LWAFGGVLKIYLHGISDLMLKITRSLQDVYKYFGLRVVINLGYLTLLKELKMRAKSSKVATLIAVASAFI
jgi:hypothetical protein